ncbi:MAG: ribosome small subunit-dependent GTPase A [Synechococcus sp.]|nr:ribosome small subunit-dependent GTPase A [Synechococcus sp.]
MVVALQANYLEVELDPPDHSTRLLCTRRTRLNHRGAAVHVGDCVWVEAIDFNQGRAVVADVEPRSSWLNRPPVANVTAVVVAFAMDQPSFDPDQASRFLLTAEQTGLAVQVLLTKCDLLPLDQRQDLMSRLRGWGYDPLAISSSTGEGLDALRQLLQRQPLSVLCGPSGVGKSSLLNGLLPELSLRVGAVSGRLQKGRHTTRHVELHPLGDGSRVADTPGFNRPELPRELHNLEVLFPELRSQLESHPCRFRDCLHRDEPGCGVTRDWERYGIYRRAVEELLDLNRPSRGG